MSRVALLHGLTARLAAAFAAVACVAIVTAGLVGALVAPPLFHRHLHHALPQVTTDVLVHADEAFGSAYVVSLAVALVLALVVSVAAGSLIARRLARSVQPLADAAQDVAAGRYTARVTGPSMGRELDHVTAAFNDMAARLEAVEATRRRLITDLAHEMRTPVATLAAYLEGLEDGVTTLDDSTRAALRAEISRLARLAEDTAAVSRAEEGGVRLAPEMFEPAALVSSAVTAAAERFAAADVDLRTDVAPGLPPAWGDEDRLGQVLSNLLDNALRHTPRGGTVIVTCRTVVDTLVIDVADTGTGIGAEDLPHVFERFYRVGTARDRSSGGFGIGLTITRALVEAHGGRVTARSEGLGRGATFTVVLPVQSPVRPEPSPALG